MEPITWGALLVLVGVLAAILGAVEARSRFLFVVGIALFILAHLVFPDPTRLGMGVAVVGIVMAVLATVPLLQHPA